VNPGDAILGPVRALPLLFAAAVLSVASRARAEDRLPGEAAELTPEVREKAKAHVAAIVAGKAPEKAARALLLLGPVVWPVVEEVQRVTVADEPKPWFAYLKALLVPKAEPDFEELRRRLRRTLLGRGPSGAITDLSDFRRGRPDPEQKGKRLPLAVPAQPLENGAKAYRSSDGSIVVAFGVEGTDKAPDGGDVSISDERAGIVAAVAGRGIGAPTLSGRGGHASAVAENGWAFAFGADGADGQKPGGQAGDGGIGDGRGALGAHLQQGKPGKHAPP
jgi:hypothetical protein